MFEPHRLWGQWCQPSPPLLQLAVATLSRHVLVVSFRVRGSLKNYKAAVADAKKCVELAPDWSKGYSRTAPALSRRCQNYGALSYAVCSYFNSKCFRMYCERCAPCRRGDTVLGLCSQPDVVLCSTDR